MDDPVRPSVDERLRRAGLPGLPRSAWLEIDQDALTDNLRAVRGLVGPDVEVSAVVKADGYGHGLEVAARTFAAAGATRLCVATLDEALALRRAGVRAPVLILFAIPAAEVRMAVAEGFELVAADPHSALGILAAWRRAPEAASAGSRGLALHLEVETGLTRAGIILEGVADVAGAISDTLGARLAGIWSHLASAERPDTSAEQERVLLAAAEALRAAGIPPPSVHLAASGGLFAGTSPHHGMVRPGLCLYGELADELPISAAARGAASALRPAMTLKARALRILEVPTGTAVGYGGRWRAERPSRIATLPLGYGDGWIRGYQPGASALVQGRRVPLAGTIAMDALAVDVTDVPGVGLEDEFVLLGSQGEACLSARELALRRDTIAWEVLVGMAHRLPRVYHSGREVTGIRTSVGEVLVKADPQVRAARRPERDGFRSRREDDEGWAE
ncbi:MAG: alanine racemase [Chloroflexota bacterium]|nr:alanine racemase [Chloroflexota bacterium]